MLARAKLNLALHVTGQRQRGTQVGYHLLHSLVAFADVGDEVSFKYSKIDRLIVDGPYAEGTPALNNNSMGAALALVRSWGEARDPVDIHLTKNLPLASGIGGGSADAAALITLLTKGRALSDREKAECLALGADVPMCLVGTPAIIGGIGEENRPVSLPSAHVVLVNPGVGVSTPAVFKALDRRTNSEMPDWSTPRSFSGLIAFLRATRNDLMAPAISLVPEIRNCLEVLADAPFARMSGSGATCFALLETRAAAEELATQTQNAHPNWWVRVGILS